MFVPVGVGIGLHSSLVGVSGVGIGYIRSSSSNSRISICVGLYGEAARGIANADVVR